MLRVPARVQGHHQGGARPEGVVGEEAAFLPFAAGEEGKGVGVEPDGIGLPPPLPDVVVPWGREEAPLGEPVELIMTSDRGTVLLRLVTPEYGLLVVLAPGGSLGRARFELRKAASRVRPELEG